MPPVPPECPSPLKGQIIAGMIALFAPALIYAYESGVESGRLTALEKRIENLPATFPPVATEVRITNLERTVESLAREWLATTKEMKEDIKSLQRPYSDSLTPGQSR